MREHTWQFVCTTSELAKPGDFVTSQILGQPVVVRNFEGEIAALSNVCAHRHSLIRSEPAGSMPELQCQYHGWCYAKDGMTRKIPCAKDFAPIDRVGMSIPNYRVAQVGQLVFISLAKHGPSLEEFLGPMFVIYQDRCGDDWFVSLMMQAEYDANWKVAIENTLEAYHVQSVHPNSFKTAPSEERSIHCFNAQHSSFETDMPFAAESRIDLFFQRTQGSVVRWLGGQPRRTYEHHHLYPNLLTSFTDAITLIQSVEPISATRSRSTVRQFGFRPTKLSKLGKFVATRWGKFEAAIGKGILAEDYGMLPKIQLGLQSSHSAGVLARSEERIASFQSFWCDRMFHSEHCGGGI